MTTGFQEAYRKFSGVSRWDPYQALWEELSTSGTQPPTVKRWAGTFTVGRFQPPSQDALLQNRLGLCVTAFDISPQT